MEKDRTRDKSNIIKNTNKTEPSWPCCLGPGEVQQWPMYDNASCVEEMDFNQLQATFFGWSHKGISWPSGIPEDKINNLT